MTAVARRRAGRALGALAIVLAGLGLSACGDSGQPADLAAGKTTFGNLCASCHTLADSGKAPTTVGPNLDDSFRAARQAGFDESQFQGTVERWIRIAQLPMPRDLVTGQDAKDVAAYIASVAGKSPESAVFPPTPTPEVPNPSRQQIN